MQSEEHLRDWIEKSFGRKYINADLSKVHEFLGDAPVAQRRLTNWVKNPKGFLVLIGPPGTGKTFFCAALFRFLYPRFFFEMHYMPERRLYNMMRRTFGEKDQDYLSYLEEIAKTHLIFLDDVGSSGHTDFREEILFDFVDMRYSSEKPTVLTGNLTPDGMRKHYDERIVSRIFSKESIVIDLAGDTDYRGLHNA